MSRLYFKKACLSSNLMEEVVDDTYALLKIIPRVLLQIKMIRVHKCKINRLSNSHTEFTTYFSLLSVLLSLILCLKLSKPGLIDSSAFVSICCFLKVTLLIPGPSRQLLKQIYRPPHVGLLSNLIFACWATSKH